MRKLVFAAVTPFTLMGVIGVGAALLPTGATSLSAGTVPAAYAPLIEHYGHQCPTLSPPTELRVICVVPCV